MRFAILADIHANLEALQAVLADSKAQGCTHYAFLGDFVGYCADPKTCLDIVRGLKAPCVKGNHDEYCAAERPLDGFNPHAAKAVDWTRRQLSEDDRQWLRSLPYVLQVEDFTIVHATLDHPERWQYIFDKIAAGASFSRQTTALCFCGHTHVPLAFIRDKFCVRGGTYKSFKLERDKEFFVNVGSVGQPRDNNPDAAYVIYDKDEGIIELRRCPYDIETAKRKIREADLGR
jgi:diadenosine tetraphosphatase ApaH/serine/threonine PP2A family protein phosphatase